MDPLDGVTDIYDAIELWHDLPEDGVSLHQFLGFTWDQYADWVERGDLPEGSRWAGGGSEVQ